MSIVVLVLIIIQAEPAEEVVDEAVHLTALILPGAHLALLRVPFKSGEGRAILLLRSESVTSVRNPAKFVIGVGLRQPGRVISIEPQPSEFRRLRLAWNSALPPCGSGLT